MEGDTGRIDVLTFDLNLNFTVFNAMQLQDVTSPRKATGHAGQAGPTVKGRGAAGNATVTQRGSLKRCAGGKKLVKNTAEQSILGFFLKF